MVLQGEWLVRSFVDATNFLSVGTVGGPEAPISANFNSVWSIKGCELTLMGLINGTTKRELETFQML